MNGLHEAAGGVFSLQDEIFKIVMRQVFIFRSCRTAKEQEDCQADCRYSFQNDQLLLLSGEL